VSVALVIQHAKRTRRITLSFMPCSALPHFPVLSHIRHNFRGGGVIGRKNACSDFLQKCCLQHFSFYEEFNAVS
jgi:hypothetical protein